MVCDYYDYLMYYMRNAGAIIISAVACEQGILALLTCAREMNKYRSATCAAHYEL